MKNVEIFLIGKYEYNSKIGTWAYYLNYKKAVIKRCGQINNGGSHVRVALYALYRALEHITEPCNIIIHSKSPLGFKYPKKSSNKDLLIKIQTTINKAGHIVHFDTTDDYGRVDIWEQVYGTPINKGKVQRDVKSKPDIDGRKTPNDVFNTNKKEEDYDKIVEEQAMKSKDWREMYSDLMGPSQGTWIPGSGGY
ncbi:MAG: hypothetical protein J6A59_07380 [Lachnospiraceae bacterium]|nr:hypothetical protein [Lachnospiraceae bacterium]